MTSTTVVYKHALETVTNLNADMGTLTDGQPAFGGGTYALINSMISDLSSIKASMKTEEKKITAACSALAVSTTGSLNMDIAMTTGGDTMTASNFMCNTGPGDQATARHEGTTTAATVLPAVLISNSKNYSDSAVFGVLAGACKLISELKGGTLDNSNPPSIESTTLTV
jgi:hypothetical protein